MPINHAWVQPGPRFKLKTPLQTKHFKSGLENQCQSSCLGWTHKRQAKYRLRKIVFYQHCKYNSMSIGSINTLLKL